MNNLLQRCREDFRRNPGRWDDAAIDAKGPRVVTPECERSPTDIRRLVLVGELNRRTREAVGDHGRESRHVVFIYSRLDERQVRGRRTSVVDHAEGLDLAPLNTARFVEAVLNPSAPNQALLNAAERSRQLVGE